MDFYLTTMGWEEGPKGILMSIVGNTFHPRSSTFVKTRYACRCKLSQQQQALSTAFWRA